jgi:aspartyl-tRNA(Asn)/glutamyl-tRNA(Gln) amidotransferase subunit A
LIKLREALKLPQEELSELKKDIFKLANEKKELNAYVNSLSKVEDFEAENNNSGVPIVIKDNIQVKNWEVTSGSAILKNYIAPYDATVIKKLKESNLSPFGRANMDEFAMGSTTETSMYGKTLNPFDSERTAGGSSGGTASAVGAKIAIAGLGSDTGGSIRQPASFTGTVGMKPTYGRVSRYGLASYGSSLDQIGPITQDVQDSAILYDIISGYDSKDSTSVDRDYTPIAPLITSSEFANRKLKIAIIEDHVKDASKEIQEAFNKTVSVLEKNGHTIVKKSLLNPKYDISAYYITAMAEASSNLARYDGIRYGTRIDGKNLHETYINSRSQGFGDEVKRRILLGNFVLSSGYYDAYYTKAQKVRYLIKSEFDKIFSEVDLILSPVSPTLPFKFGEKHSPLEMYLSDIYTISVNLAGLPALSLPVDWNNNLPVGMQFIAKPFDEKTLFNGAFNLENYLK